MRIKHTHADVYDRESEYWRDIEDAKSPSKAATNDEQRNKDITINIPQNNENIHGG